MDRYAAFAVRGSPEQREDVSWLGARIGLICALGILPCLVLSQGPSGERIIGTIGGLCAVSATLVLTRRSVPTPVLDLMLVGAVGMVAWLGIAETPVRPLTPVIFILLGTGVFVIRDLRYSLAQLSVIGAAFAAQLALGPDTEGPAIRWVAVITGILISGMFVRWMVGHVIDVARSERAARADAERATAELEQLSEAKNAFLARMSHELRTPLNVILGFSDVLRDGLVGSLSERQRSYVEDIAASGRDLLALVDELLDVSKFETGAVELTTAPIDIGRAVAEAEMLVQGRARQAGVAIELSVLGRPVVAEADGLRIRQVVWNLLGNAVKFTPRGGRVTVTVRPTADTVVVSVRDTGTGIAVEDQERIFGRFERAAGRTEGSGIGLALCRRLIEAHGGRLTMASALGEGSTFTFEIPQVRAQTARRTREEPETTAPPADEADSAFLVPGSASNRVLVARVAAWFGRATAPLFALVALITPGTWWFKAQIAGLACLALVISSVLHRMEGRLPRRAPEAIGIGAAVAVSLATLVADPYTDLSPLAYGWGVLAAAALLSRRRVLAEICWIAACYLVVLLIDAPPDAFERWVAILMLIAGNAVVVGWIASRLRDVVSEALGARLAAQATQERAEAISAHKSDFLANTSHELCTPLNAIIGFTQVLQDELVGPLEPTQAQYVSDVLESGRHLLALITELLDLAKLEAGRLPSDPQLVRVDDLVETVVSEIEPIAARRDIALVTSLAADLPTIAVDRDNLQQVLVRLIANGIKFTRDRGRVELIVRLSERADRVLISVRDTGIGIVAEQRDLVFDAFHQGSRPLPAHARGGTGLGLTLAKGIVELEGGTIGVESTPGVGSTFTVSLPVHH